jgi:hypothetical protein
MIEREYKTVETRKEKRRREKVAPCTGEKHFSPTFA